MSYKPKTLNLGYSQPHVDKARKHKYKCRHYIKETGKCAKSKDRCPGSSKCKDYTELNMVEIQFKYK